MDRKLIVFILSVGLLLVGVGAVLVLLYNTLHSEYKHLRPAIVIGESLKYLRCLPRTVRV